MVYLPRGYEVLLKLTSESFHHPLLVKVIYNSLVKSVIFSVIVKHHGKFYIFFAIHAKHYDEI